MRLSMGIIGLRRGPQAPQGVQRGGVHGDDRRGQTRTISGAVVDPLDDTPTVRVCRSSPAQWFSACGGCSSAEAPPEAPAMLCIKTQRASQRQRATALAPDTHPEDK